MALTKETILEVVVCRILVVPFCFGTGYDS